MRIPMRHESGQYSTFNIHHSTFNIHHSTFNIQNSTFPMHLTPQQTAIVQAPGNCVINAVAGSGKTSTLIAYAKSRPAFSRILYIAFNKTVKEEAQRKFAAANINNVTVETAHSLAYRYVVRGSNYKVRNAYKTHELVQVLGLKGQAERHVEYIAANHILRFAAYFCNSNKSSLKDLDYRASIADKKALSFVNACYGYLQEQTKLFLHKMDEAEIEITHDYYLKKFQSLNVQLPYEYILFDEGQDASEAMLDVFMKQPATKLIVGDTHQQIYGWRHAVNSLEKVNFPCLHLSQSFRFNQTIADLALQVLQRKTYLGKTIDVALSGCAVVSTGAKNKNSKAIIARGNLTLLLRAIKYIQETKQPGKLHLEGKFSSYTYAEDGASLYDVLNLLQGKRQGIRDALLREMRDMDELEDYVEKTEDAQLGMMMEIVKKYGPKIHGIINDIKAMHVDERSKADVIFSTVHRCKGMEYDEIELAGDFVKEGDVIELAEDKEATDLQKAKMIEEINLLYVAITRTKNKLSIPQHLLPENFVAAANIVVLANKQEEPAEQTNLKQVVFERKLNPHSESFRQVLPQAFTQVQNKKAYSPEEIRKTHKKAYLPWTGALDAELTELFCSGQTYKQMAQHFGRTEGAITSRIAKLELELKYG